MAGQSPAGAVVVNGLGVALVFAAATLLHIRIPITGAGGMIHLGDLPLFVFALLYGRKTGALAGAAGLSLFDLLSGWTLWAPFTFVIAGAIGWIAGYTAEKNPENRLAPYVLSVLAANLITVVGYYIVEALLYGNWLSPVGSVPVNAVQVTAAAIFAYPAAKKIKGIRVGV